MARFFSFWRNLLRRNRVERTLDDEMQATLAALIDEKRAAGAAADAARRAALIELGGLESVKQQVRDVRSGAFVETLLQDLRYAARLLRRNPLFALTAVLSLAIGIGATTTIFSVANALLFRSAAGVVEPDRLVDIGKGAGGRGTISYPDYLDIRERAGTLEGVYAYPVWPAAMSLRAGDNAIERIYANRVSLNYFTVLGAAPAAGRLFHPGDERQEASPIVVLSYPFWERRFQKDPAVVGRTLRLNGDLFTVVGVASERFQGTNLVAADAWVPLARTTNTGAFLRLGGRLKPGVPLAAAVAELEVIGRSQDSGSAARLPGAAPATLSATPSSLVPGAGGAVGGFITLLMSLVSLLLLTACINLAGVSLARATARRREIALRMAIGAGRSRLLRQLLTETALLFAVGGAAGLVLTRWMTAALVLALPTLPFPVDVSFALDWRVLAFTAGVSMVAAVLSGLAPALQASKTPVVSAMKDDGAPGTGGRPRLRSTFVMAQVALSLVLVVVGGLVARAARQAGTVGLGFDPEGVEVTSLDLSLGGYTDTSGPRFGRELVERVRALPDVADASLAFVPPGGFEGLGLGELVVPGVEPPAGETSFDADWNVVEPGYFSTLRIPLVAGRDITAADRVGAPDVAIVTEATARRFWPGQNAIGKSLLLKGGFRPETRSLLVIGVVADVSFGSVVDGVSPLYVYVPFQQHYLASVTLLARTTRGQRAVNEIRAVIASMNPDMPVVREQTLADGMALSLVPQRIAALVSGSLGLVGVLLAAIGVYGVTAYAVARRTREIGIRLALGAERSGIILMVLRQAMTIVIGGLAIGLVLAAGAGQLVSVLLYGVPALDPLAFAGAVALFLAVGLCACYGPVYRATRIRATEALRYE